MKDSLFNHPRADQLTGHLTPWLSNGLAFLLAAVPFHAFAVTVLGHEFGHQLIIASWKEVLQFGIIAGVLVLAVFNHNWRWLQRGTNRAFLIAIGFGLLASCLGQGFGVSWLAGVKTTVLPLVLFIAVQPLAEHFTDRRLARLILIPALVVAGLAILQFLIVPTDFLTSVGYNGTTILPYQGVHPGFDVARAFSTLGGPNQLGAYLILPATWLLFRGLSEPLRQARIISSIGFVTVLTGLALSFSRSAILGLVTALIILFALYVPVRWRWAVFVLTGLAGWLAWVFIMQIVSSSGTAWSSFFLRGSLLSTGIVGGDSGHVQSILNGVQGIIDHPLGLGLGSAGPASFFRPQPNLTENWWLQIAFELGIPGLLAVLTGWVLMFKHWHTHLDQLDRILLATMSGLAVSSLFLHTFGDSTLAIITLALAGLVYGRHWSSKSTEIQK